MITIPAIPDFPTDIPALVAALRAAQAQHTPDGTSDGCASCNDGGCCYGQVYPCACLREILLPEQIEVAR